MKKGIFIALILILLCTGAYGGYRYRHDVYLPKKRTAEALEKQEELFDAVRPDIQKASEAAAAHTSEIGSEAKEPDSVETVSPLTECIEFCDDTVGWLYVPDTGLDYPVVQGSDNSFYLNRGLDREWDPFGLPFLDYRCAGDFSGFNSVIYAHNFENMAMFAPVGLFKDPSYMEKHPSGLLITDSGAEEIEFFAYITAPADSPVYDTVHITDREKLDYAELLLHTAVHHTDISAEELSAKRLIMLSTCTFEYDEARGILAGFIRE